jgi:membrane protein
MIGKEIVSNLKSKAVAGYRRANDYSFGIPALLLSAGLRFLEVRAAQAAAAIAYYALFSIFPLLLFLVAIASSVLKSPEIQDQIMRYVQEFLPGFEELVQTNIDQALYLRGTVGLVGMIGLLWAALAVFSVVTNNISLAWRNAELRNYLELRLMAVAMVGSLVVLMVLASLFTAITDILSSFQVPVFGSVSIHDSILWQLASRYIPKIVVFVSSLLLYWWAPNTTVKWREAAWGALLATVGFELAKTGFQWYLSSRFARQALVYGSLGTVIALMLWIYVTAMVLLLGAHLSAAIGHHREAKQKEDASDEAPSGITT